MRCTKCGYVSFDFHSDCRKCGTNLAAIRECLGFQAVKPAVPFLLGSLLKDYVKPPAKTEKDLTAESSLPALDFGEEFEPASGANGKSTAVAHASPKFGETASETYEGEEFNLLDLSSEELDLLIEDQEPLEPAARQAPQPPAAAPAAVSGATTVSGEAEDSGFVFDEDALSGLSTKTEEHPSPGPGLARPDVAAGNGALVIELSDQELENILVELEGADGGEKTNKNETSDDIAILEMAD